MFKIEEFKQHTLDFVRVCSVIGLKKLLKDYKVESEQGLQSNLGNEFTGSALFKYYKSNINAFAPLTEQQMLNIFCDAVENSPKNKFEMNNFLLLVQNNVDSKDLFSIPTASEHKPTTPERMFKTIKKTVSDTLSSRFSFLTNRSSNNNNNNNQSDKSDNSSEDLRSSPFGRSSS